MFCGGFVFCCFLVFGGLHTIVSVGCGFILVFVLVVFCCLCVCLYLCWFRLYYTCGYCCCVLFDCLQFVWMILVWLFGIDGCGNRWWMFWLITCVFAYFIAYYVLIDLLCCLVLNDECLSLFRFVVCFNSVAIEMFGYLGFLWLVCITFV